MFGTPNKFTYQRLFGELSVDGFSVSHTKDGLQWEEWEPDILEWLRTELDKDPLPLIRQAEGFRARAGRTSPEPGFGLPAVSRTTRALQCDDPISEEEFRNVREEARRVLANAFPAPRQPEPRTGLVVGYVQSGKTMSMAALSALAFDNGIRLIIALSGVTKNLHRQSVERFERDLRGSEVGLQTWVILANPTVSANRQDLSRLVQEWRSAPPQDHQALFMVVMKNHAHLRALAQLLQAANLQGIRALVIDDEADQADLDTRPGTGNPSSTHRRIREVRAQLPEHTYLQYTRSRTARNKDEIIDLHQGRDPHGGAYPGDAKIFDPADLTVQLHRLNVITTEGTLEDVYAIAIHIPSSWRGDVVVPPTSA